jgi:hypothetical protein
MHNRRWSHAIDVSAADPREHFLGSLIVAYLGSNIGTKDNDGFISGMSVVVEMAQHGYVDQQVRHALRRLATKRLIETPHAHYRELQVAESEPPEQFYYRATSSGVYHYRFWTGSFAFIDATATDTPIFETQSRDEVARLAPSFEISDRYRKAMAFRSYLEDQWHAANIRSSYYDFSALLVAQEDSFAAVRKAIERTNSVSQMRHHPVEPNSRRPTRYNQSGTDRG